MISNWINVKGEMQNLVCLVMIEKIAKGLRWPEQVTAKQQHQPV